MAVKDYKITQADIQGRGLSEQPRFPQLKSPDMQRKFDELVLDVVMPKHNALVDTIDGDYATKRYVGEQMAAAGAGDMARAIYDTNEDGIVDEAAVAARAENGIDEYAHLKQEGVHKLTNEEGSNNIKFYATADFVEGDIFQVNGVACAAETMDGAPIAAGTFKTGTQVLCLKVGTVLVFPVGMPLSGGTFAGDAFACSANRSTAGLRNIVVRTSEQVNAETNAIIMDRK